MSKALQHLRQISILASLAAVSGCSSIVAVKDVLADRNGYLSQHFTPQAAAEGVVKKFPNDSKTAVSFSQLTLSIDGAYELSDGKKDTSKITNNYAKTTNGLLQRTQESSSNGIPYSQTFALTYKGLVDLKWQHMSMRNVVTGSIYEIKNVVKIDPLPTRKGQEFTADYTTGPSVQIANFPEFHKNCKSVNVRPASEIHASLAGQVIDLDCENYAGKVLDTRSKWALLQDYGVAILLETTSSTSKSKFTVTDVNITL